MSTPSAQSIPPIGFENFYAVGYDEATSTEVLFLAMRLLQASVGDEWVATVLKERRRYQLLKREWTSPWPPRSAVLSTYNAAISDQSSISLKAVAIAMACCGVDGHTPSAPLCISKLRKYIQHLFARKGSLRGPVRGQHGTTSPRHVSAIVRVAELLHCHGKRLGAALTDVPAEELNCTKPSPSKALLKYTHAAELEARDELLAALSEKCERTRTAKNVAKQR